MFYDQLQTTMYAYRLVECDVMGSDPASDFPALPFLQLVIQSFKRKKSSDTI